MIRPLFIVGNKRSGTSQLVRVLNLHPRVFVSHESDILWILYQFHQDQAFRQHPWDSDRGMRQTLEECGRQLRREQSPWENFLAVQQQLMEKGTPFLPPQRKSDLLWIGDKKPFQHTDPQLLAFISENFPDAHFLHIVRHPFAVAASSARFNRTRDGDFWLGLSLEEKVEQWAFHEQQVLALRQHLPGRLHSLRYEDLCRGTAEELSRVFQFLQLEPDPQLLQEAALQNHPAAHQVPVIRCSAEAMHIAANYGYDLQDPATPLRAFGESHFRGMYHPLNR
jgi:hypothetical protein